MCLQTAFVLGTTVRSAAGPANRRPERQGELPGHGIGGDRAAHTALRWHPCTDKLADRAKAYADSCQRKYGWLLPHMTTQDSARDMDSIRAAFGVFELNYLGFCYGTYLGQVLPTPPQQQLTGLLSCRWHCVRRMARLTERRSRARPAGLGPTRRRGWLASPPRGQQQMPAATAARTASAAE